MTERVILRDGDATLVLAPELGGSIAEWSRAGEALFRPCPPGPLESQSARTLASYPLVPYSNRVGGRRFSFAGETHELPELMNGHAIHGAGWQLPWTARQDGTSASMTLDFQPGPLWPFAFQAQQTFTLTETMLTCSFSIENRHSSPAPAGFGFHPYFPRSPEARLQFDADGVWLGVIPTHRAAVPPEWDHREGRQIGSATVDNCFTGWGGHARLIYPDRGYAIDLSADPIYRHLIVFVPEGRDFYAVEPVTNMNDGLNRMDGDTDHGVFVLAPGESRSGVVRFRLNSL